MRPGAEGRDQSTDMSRVKVCRQAGRGGLPPVGRPRPPIARGEEHLGRSVERNDALPGARRFRGDRVGRPLQGGHDGSIAIGRQRQAIAALTSRTTTASSERDDGRPLARGIDGRCARPYSGQVRADHLTSVDAPEREQPGGQTAAQSAGQPGVPLDSRQARIARHLLESAEPATIEEIAALVGLTPRVVRYNLPSIDAVARPAGLRLVLRRGVGAWVDGDPAARAALLERLHGNPGPPVVDASERRLRAIAALLDAAPRPVRLEDLEREFGVSRPTVRRDVRAAEPWLERHQLHLQRMPGSGLVVRGTEIDIRKGLLAVLLEAEAPEVLLAETDADPADRPPAIRHDQLGRTDRSDGLIPFIRELDLPTHRAILAKQLRTLDSADPMVMAAAIYLAIVTRRVRDGRSASLEGGQLRSLMDHPVADAATRIAADVEAVFESSWTDPDVASITEFLLGFVELSDEPATPEPADIGLIDAIITAAAARLHPALADDDRLRRSLVEHAHRLRLRLRYGLPISNPLQQEVRDRYPDVYDVAAVILADVGPVGGTDVPEEEVGFLTMYLAGSLERNRLRSTVRVAVVCPAGMATAWILVSRLLAEFPQLEIVRVVSKAAYEGALDESGIDLVVSTVPLESGNPDVARVIVSPLLRARDIRRLSRVVGDPTR